jgi:hypothetical protein
MIRPQTFTQKGDDHRRSRFVLIVDPVAPAVLGPVLPLSIAGLIAAVFARFIQGSASLSKEANSFEPACQFTEWARLCGLSGQASHAENTEEDGWLQSVVAASAVRRLLILNILV